MGNPARGHIVSEVIEQESNLPAIPEQARYSNAPTKALQEIAWTARALVNAATLPRALQGKPGDILAVMLAGRELGIGPMASTRMVHIINGQTSIATELKLGLAAREGHEVIALAEGPGWCIVGCTGHPEAPPVGWRMAEDTEAPDYPGLYGWTIAGDIRQGNSALVDKDNWRNYQRDMLFWRASGQFMRRHCPGLAGGLYTLEELGGSEHDAEA
jgi:hypothetical protein